MLPVRNPVLAIESGNVEISFFGYVIMFVMTVAWTADLAISASRIFRVEMRGQTLSSLAALPFSLGWTSRCWHPSTIFARSFPPDDDRKTYQ